MIFYSQIYIGTIVRLDFISFNVYNYNGVEFYSVIYINVEKEKSMKRGVKILVLLFTVLLISGITALYAFADSETVGVIVNSSENLEYVYSGLNATASGGKNQNVGEMTAQIGGRAGSVKLSSSLPYEKNSYLVYTLEDKVGTVNPYIWSTVGTRPTVEELNECVYDMSGFSYYSFDMDVMSPSGKFISGSSVDFSARCRNAAGEVAIWSNTALSKIVTIGSDSTGSYIALNGVSSSKTYVDPYEFSHITCIVETDVTASSYKANAYLYINGRFVGYKAGTTGTTSYYGGIVHASMLEYRINFPLSSDPTQTLAMDNVTFRSFTNDYNGNLSSVLSQKSTLDSWESNLYDADEMPAGFMQAFNEDTDAYYRTVSEAISEAKAGQTVHIVTDCAEPIVINKTINVNILDQNGEEYGVTFTPADGIISYQKTHGLWCFDSADTVVYEYTSGGKALTAGRSVTLADVISAADTGTTVKIKSDIYLTLSAAITVSKNLTLDLGGNTAYFGLAYKKSGISLSANKSLTIKNGTLVGEYSSPSYAGKSYPLVWSASGSNLVLEDVNTYTGTLVWSYSGNNFKVTVNGGEHYIAIKTTDCNGGFIESRANTTFVANDATFYCGNKGNGLLSSLHYKCPTGSTPFSSFTYNNCKIIGESANTNILKSSDKNTEIYFNGCEIYGSIDPAVSTYNEAYAPVVDGSIVLGEGTEISNNSTVSSAVRAADGCAITSKSVNRTYTLNLHYGMIADSTFGFVTKEKNVILQCVSEKCDSFEVTWYKEDGKTVLKTESVKVGETVTPPEYTPVNNGWFEAEYSGWSTSLYGAPINNFTVKESCAFYPAIAADSVPVAKISGARYNLSLIGAIGVNLYIPAAPSGVEILSVKRSDGEVIFGKRVFVGAEEFTLYNIGAVGATSLADFLDVTVEFTALSQTLSESFSLSPYMYAKAILDNSKSEYKSYPDSAYTLVADMIRYSVNLGSYVAYAGGSSVDKSISVLYSEYNSLCSTLLNDFSDTGSVDVSGLIGYVSSVAYEVSAYQPSYKLTFKSGSGVVDAYVTVEGYYKNEVGGANWGSVTYKATDKVTYSGTDNLSSASIRNIPMYNMDKDITITVLLSNGTLKSGVYSINGYYNNVSVSTLEKARLSAFLGSMRSFADSAAKYRHATEIITAENAVDFRKCDHTGAISVTFNEKIGAFPAIVPAKYCPECDSYLISYADFGVMGDGASNGLNPDGSANASGTNDFAAIREAHTKANLVQTRHPEYTVVLLGRGIVGNSFYIGVTDDNGANPISVKTNVDWDGAHFIIDDTTVTNKNGGTEYRQSLFSVVSDAEIPTFTISDSMPSGVPAGATNVGFAPGEPLMLQLNNASVRHYIRYGANANSGAVQTEVIIIDAYGNVNPTTPVQWDYTAVAYCSYLCTPADSDSDGKCDTCGKTVTTSFSAKAKRIDDKPIIISGLDKDGNINCIWETITNCDVDVSSYDQFKRNIHLTRANVTVEGFDRIFVEDGSSLTPRQTYAGIVNVNFAYNTVIKDMLVYNHLGHNIWIDGVDTKNGLGSYEFGGSLSINTSWINCRSKNLFYSDGAIKYRGLFGSNYLRNSYLKNCALNSFDSHSGAYNVTIEDSTFEHINYVGGGDVLMKNVTVYVNGGYAACILRSDYGSMWKGNIMMDGITLRHPITYTRGYVDLVRAHYNNHYFGYDSYLPEKIYVNDIKIEEYNRTTGVYTVENGQVVEPTAKKSEKKLGIFNIINGELKNDYDYSTVNENNKDPKHCTEAIYITNSDVELSYPDHWFFDDMKVYIDGIEQDWFVVRDGLHADANRDGVCDNGCGQPLG